jgi:hypothetical protein
VSGNPVVLAISDPCKKDCPTFISIIHLICFVFGDALSIATLSDVRQNKTSMDFMH